LKRRRREEEGGSQYSREDYSAGDLEQGIDEEDDDDEVLVRPRQYRKWLCWIIMLLPFLFLVADVMILSPASSNANLYGFIIFSTLMHTASWMIVAFVVRYQVKNMLPESWLMKSFWMATFFTTGKILQSELFQSIKGYDWAHIDESALHPSLRWYWLANELVKMILLIWLAVVNLRKYVYHIRKKCCCLKMKTEVDFEKEENQPLLFSSHSELLTNESQTPMGNVWKMFLKGNRKSSDILSNGNSVVKKITQNPKLRFVVVSASVTSWMEVSSGREKSKIKYAIHVRSINRGAWTVWKKYTDFAVFHDETIVYKGLTNETLPLPQEENSDLQTQKNDLNSYLQSFLYIDSIRDQVSEFLGYHGKTSSLKTSPVRSGNQANLSMIAEIANRMSNLVYVDAKVMDHKIWKTVDSKGYFLSYTLSVSTSLEDWRIIKRYKDFETLQGFYCREMSHLNYDFRLGDSKEYVNEPKEIDIEYEKENIKAFLSFLISEAELQCLPLDEFLCKPEEFHDSEIWLGSGPQSPSYKATKYNPKQKEAKKGPKEPSNIPKQMHRFESKLVNVEVVNKGGLLDTYAEYEFQILEFFTFFDYISWNIRKRFSDFTSLNQSLEERFPDKELPTLPKKNNFLSLNSSVDFDSEFFAERKEMLSQYLFSLCEDPSFHSKELFTFIELDNSNRTITPGTLTSQK
jgi:hypothetical protein